jgi:hypothetical protein
MILTEEEAKKCWCPFARVAFAGQHVGNRPSSSMIRFAEDEAKRTGAAADSQDLRYLLEQRADTMCIGSRCMAWQEAGPLFELVPQLPPYPPKTIQHPREGEGFCGLAVRP